MITDLVGYFAGTLLMLSFLPQVIKTFKLKHAEDVSMWMLVFTLGSGVLYEVYAWHLLLTPVLVMNGIFVLMVIAEICLKIIYDFRNRRRSQ